MTKQELKNEILELLAVVDKGCDKMEDLDADTTAELRDVVDQFRRLVKGSRVTKKFLVMLIWAFKLGGVYTLFSEVEDVPIVIVNLEPTKLEEDDELVH